MERIYKEKVIEYIEKEKNKHIVYITSSNKNIDYYISNLENDNIHEFDNISTEDDMIGTNIELINILNRKEKQIVFVNFQIALQMFFEEVEYIDFNINKEYMKRDIQEFLNNNNYISNYIIEKKGEYSIRGDIFDIFPSNCINPIRLDFFDRELENIKTFSIDDQKSIENMKEIRIYANKLMGEYKEFTELIKIFDKNNIKIIIENKELIDYKLQEYILINRDKEEILNKRYDNLLNSSELIEVIKNEDKIYDIKLNKENIKRRGVKYKKANQIVPGDYVIHIQYGVGIYKGIITIDDRDYLNVQYADKDNLYIPIDKLNRLEKYVVTGDEPKLYKLGTRGFKKKEKKLREDIVQFAGELIRVQALREKGNGTIYAKDSAWQHEFEEKFPFYETLDQKKAIYEVKEDMESPKIMDRIICGDVGYGKTEVAMRAAFKAVDNGKQVAIIAPTTVLASQHFDRFTKRFSGYPIDIINLSRLNTSEHKKNLEKLKKGISDIVIGTHRLLSGDVLFKNLSLLIIDEEQKFGVKAKEILKKHKSNVDVLTMTATPIPRTLNLALLGIRDISVIETPPVNRLPIITEIIPDNNEEELAKAILKELSRDGQVFYISNDVKNMKEKKQYLQKILPKFIKIEYIHGQLPSSEIKHKLEKFENGEYDILIASTIIENGIDIPNANTIIIEKYTHMGLSQIYQLRGRVGRSNRQGYCYLLQEEYATKKGKQKKDSIKNIEGVIAGGFKISMDDLKIRGAGEILGEKQHGSIETFGYDLYLKMLDEEIKKKKGVYKEKIEDVFLQLRNKAYIPEEYISGDERLNVYKRIAMADTYMEIEDIMGELRDRFGRFPKELVNFFNSIDIKIYCQYNNIERIIEQDDNYIIYLKTNLQDRLNVISLSKEQLLYRIKVNKEYEYKRTR